MPIEHKNQQRLTVAEDVTDIGNSGTESAANDPKIESGRVWHLYVLQCADNSLYCGIALNVKRRLAQHQKGKGAKYTRSRLPVTLLSCTAIGPNVADALAAERRFKTLPRAKKLSALRGASGMLG